MESVDDAVGALSVLKYDLGDNVRPGRYDDAFDDFASNWRHCALNVCCSCAGSEILGLNGGWSCNAADRQAGSRLWNHIELSVQVGG